MLAHVPLTGKFPRIFLPVPRGVPRRLVSIDSEARASLPPVKLALLVLLIAGCFPRGVDVPVAYTTRARAGTESLSCAKRELTDLGFQFREERAQDDKATGTRVSRRGTQTRLLEVALLELSGEGDRRILKLTLGVIRGRGSLAPDATPLAVGSLSAPSRQSIREVDEVMARCQRSPMSGGEGA